MQMTMKHILLGAAALAAALALASPALAVDMSTPITDPDGNPIQVCSDHEDGPAGPKTGPLKKDCEKIATVGRLVAMALWQGSPDEKDARTGVSNVDIKEAIRRDDLARLIYKQADVPLDADDRAMIKKLVGKVYPVMSAAQIARVVDPPEKQEKK